MQKLRIRSCSSQKNANYKVTHADSHNMACHWKWKTSVICNIFSGLNNVLLLLCNHSLSTIQATLKIPMKRHMRNCNCCTAIDNIGNSRRSYRSQTDFLKVEPWDELKLLLNAVICEFECLLKISRCYVWQSTCHRLQCAAIAVSKHKLFSSFWPVRAC